jgi:primosomal protein N'
MRAIHLRRICLAFHRLQLTSVIPPKPVFREFHCSPLQAVAESEGSEISPPRKRGRPKNVKLEDTTVEATHSITEVANAETIITTPVKTRKKAPKISDIARLIPPTTLQPSPSRPLRPYQEECVEACLKAISEGKRRLGISLATGAGKTVIFTNLIGKVQLEDTKRYQTLILVHRRELVEQAARHCVEVYPDKVIYQRGKLVKE